MMILQAWEKCKGKSKETARIPDSEWLMIDGF